MLLEALEHLLTPCPRRWRRLGYLREQIAIDARLARNRDAWGPHLLSCRTQIMKAAQTGGGAVLILGAGLHHDLPLSELANIFGCVHLCDLVHRPLARWCARRLTRGHVRFHEQDASGLLDQVHNNTASLQMQPLAELAARGVTGLPAGMTDEPELVVSANLASQLMLLPLEWIERVRPVSPDEARTLQSLAFRAHVAWLRVRTGRKVLITETALIKRSVDGDLIETTPTPGVEFLPEPSARWTWNIAPIPELNRHQHVEHAMGAWLL